SVRKRVSRDCYRDVLQESHWHRPGAGRRSDLKSGNQLGHRPLRAVALEASPRMNAIVGELQSLQAFDVEVVPERIGWCFDVRGQSLVEFRESPIEMITG